MFAAAGAWVCLRQAQPVAWLLLVAVRWRLVASTPQTLFYVDDLITQFGAESKLWMMTGEDASLGTRKIRYDDLAYCLEAHGTLDGSVCKPTYLINGWNDTDGTSVADRKQIGRALDPAGEGDGEHVIGPAVDKTNRRVYFITQSCLSDTTRRLATRVWRVKVLLDNQITPEASQADPLNCANESYVYAVNRYDVDTQKYSMLYAQVREEFPAPDKFNARSFKIAFDSQRQRLYWWYNAGGCAVVKTCPAPLYYISVDGLEDNGDPPSPVLAVQIADGYGHWYWDLCLDSNNNALMMDWYKIRRWNVASNTLETLWEEDYLNTGWHFTGIAAWGDRILVAKTSTVTSQVWVFDPAAASGSQWTELYRQILYEFFDLGMNVYNMVADADHGVFYAAISGGNSAARAIVELPLVLPSWSTQPPKACLYGWQLDCPLYAKGERLVVGHMPSAFSVVGTGKSTNFAPGTADRFPADGTSQLAVLPAAPSVTYPARNPCSGRSSAAGLDTLSAKLKATSRNRCGTANSQGYNTRHFLYGVDAKTDKNPNYLLRDYISLEGLRTASSGGFGYDKVGNRRAYYNFMELATGGGDMEDFPGLKDEDGYGNAIKGPAVDYVHGFIYWMSCENADLPGLCSEWALKRVPISVVETAAAIPDPVDCRTTSCPFSGDPTVLSVRHQKIAEGTQVLYKQSTQLFPGPDDTRTQTTKLAVDPDAEIVYWMTSALALGTSVLAYIDVGGWTPDQPPLEPCDVGILGTHYENGAWTSLQVMCDGSVLSHEIDALKVLNLANDTHVQACKDAAVEWSQLAAGDRPGFKGCWQRLFGGEGLGCTPSAGTGGCSLKTVTYDTKRDQIYYAFRKDARKESLARFNRTAGPRGRDVSTGELLDEIVYSGIFYEWPPRNDKGAQFISGMAIDDVNDELYVASYYGNSAKQNVITLPLPENSLYPGANRDVHSNYWPMDLVAENDAPIACLYGHESIPSSSGYGNRECEYQGERLPQRWRTTGMRVLLPDQDGLVRFYITETSGSMAVLPARAEVMQTRREAVFDWTQFFTMLPHAETKLSKLNGWSYMNVPVTTTDLGWQPSPHFCAEMCSVMWRSGNKRCIGFDWYMSNTDCFEMQRAGLLPSFSSSSSCIYSNSGLKCIFITVPLDSADDDDKAWPNPCFTWPTTDRDGSPWLNGAANSAPAGGWPPEVQTGRFMQDGFSGKRTLHYELNRSLFEDSEEGRTLRKRWRTQVPRSQYYGSARPKFPSDLEPYIFDVADIQNPNSMATEPASCFPNDGGFSAAPSPGETTTTVPPTTTTEAPTEETTLPSAATTTTITTTTGPTAVQIDMTLNMDYTALTSNATLVEETKQEIESGVRQTLPSNSDVDIEVEFSQGSVVVQVTVTPKNPTSFDSIKSTLQTQSAQVGQAVLYRVRQIPGIAVAAPAGGSINLVGEVSVSAVTPTNTDTTPNQGVAPSSTSRNQWSSWSLLAFSVLLPAVSRQLRPRLID